MSVLTDPSRPDLRARRRLATMDDIEQAALGLFEQQGVEGTTVDEIAAAAGISPRTFFRYCATKEDAVLRVQRAMEEVLAERCAALSPDRPLLGQVEAVFEQVLQRHGGEQAADRLLRVRCLMLAEQSLRAAAMGVSCEQTDRLAASVAEAIGAGPDDVTPRLVVEAASTELRVALDAWAARRDAGEDADLVEVFHATACALRGLVG